MKEIAIIGIAGRFPEAENLDAFYRNLIQAKDSVRPVSEERIQSTTIPHDIPYLPFAYLDDVDKFDHSFFRISHQEAIHMDPHQRMIMEIVYHTLESSGQPIPSFAGTKTAVILSDYSPTYFELAEQFDPTLVTGTLSAFTAGRIARYFNFTGMATMVNTTCSSSLVGLHLACNLIRSGEADMAIAGGAVLYLKPPEKNAPYNMGVISPDGITRAFSADANGTGMGESVVCVLLKELNAAVRDGDIIYGVLKGSAVNQDAMRSGSLTAPSSKAQAEVIESAWQQADIDPASISYIEAHGTATRLGDPVEVSGIESAFRKYTNQNGFCALTSVKSNIGHTGNIAGMVSIAKVVLGMQYRQLFPAANFSKPSPFINFSKLPVYINTELTAWNQPLPLRAGISSFGLMGTNCHVVMESYERIQEKKLPINQPFLFCLSAQSKHTLARKMEDLTCYLETTTHSLADISFSLNQGKEHFDYRWVGIASNKEELVQLLANASVEKINSRLPSPLFLCSGNLERPLDYWKWLLEHNPLLRALYEEECAGNMADNITESSAQFLIPYLLLRMMNKLKLPVESLVGIGNGEYVVNAFLDELPLSEAIHAFEHQPMVIPDDLELRLQRLIESEQAQNDTLFVELMPNGRGGRLMETLAKRTLPAENRQTFVTKDTSGFNLLQLIGYLYTHGYQPYWEALYGYGNVTKVPTPHYPFDKIRCWIRENTSPIKQNDNPIIPDSTPEPDVVWTATTDTSGWTEMEKTIGAMWFEVLKRSSIDLDDDFFDLGGNSLLTARIISRIEQKYNVKLRFRDVYIFATIRSLSAGVEKLIQDQQFTGGFPPLVKVSDQPYYELSFAQRRLWILDKLQDDNFVSYTAPYAIHMRGPLHIQALDKAFHSLLIRHEILRTVIVEVDGVPYQKILSDIHFQLERISMEQQRDTNTWLDEEIRRRIFEPFQLHTGPLIRATIFTQSEEEHVLLLVLHHIVSDGWSLGVLLKEMFYLYQHFEKVDQELPDELPIQYKDYAHWHNQLLKDQHLATARAYWLEKFGDAKNRAELPLDFPRQATQTYQGDTLTFQFNEMEVKQIASICSQADISLFSFLIGMSHILLYHLTGDEEQTTGSPIAGRIHPLVESLIGFFVNTLPLKNKVQPNLSVLQFLQSVHANNLEAFENQAYPFDLIVEESNQERQRNRNPLFDVLIVLQNNELEEINFGSLRLEERPIHFDVSLFDLMFSFWQTPTGIISRVNYNTSCFEAATIQWFIEDFTSMVGWSVQFPDETISDMLIRLKPKSQSEELSFNF